MYLGILHTPWAHQEDLGGPPRTVQRRVEELTDQGVPGEAVEARCTREETSVGTELAFCAVAVFVVVLIAAMNR